MNIRDFAKKINALVSEGHGNRDIIFYDEDNGISYEFDRAKKDSLSDEINIYITKVG